jgi:hypothetical protein
MDVKFIFLNRLPEIGCHLTAVPDGLIELGIIKAWSKRAFRLRPVHRQIGVVDQGFRGLSIGREYRNADACPEARFEMLQRHGCLQFGIEPFCEGLELAAIRKLREGDKFISPKPGNDLMRTERLTQAPGEKHEHLVACPVAVDVVDLLETVEIDHAQAKLRAGRARGLDALRQLSLKPRSVRQAGKGVVMRHVGQFLHGFRPGLAIDQGGKCTGGDDDRSDHGRGDSERSKPARIERCLAQYDRIDVHRGHGNEMERRDGGHDQPGSQSDPVAFDPVRPKDRKSRAREPNRADQRGNYISGIPRDDAVNPIGSHAHVMHPGDGQAENCAAQRAVNVPRSPSGKADADECSNDRNDQRTDREDRIKSNRYSGAERKHGDEVGAPDRRARRNRGEEGPAELLHSGRAARALEHLYDRECADGADDDSQRHQPWIVLDANTKCDLDQWTSPRVRPRPKAAAGRLTSGGLAFSK